MNIVEMVLIRVCVGVSDVADRSDGVGEGRRAQVRGVAAGPRRGAHADGGQRRRQARLGRAHQARAARPAARAQGGARATVQRATQVHYCCFIPQGN